MAPAHATKMNDTSSRSHSIIILRLLQKFEPPHPTKRDLGRFLFRSDPRGHLHFGSGCIAEGAILLPLCPRGVCASTCTFVFAAFFKSLIQGEGVESHWAGEEVGIAFPPATLWRIFFLKEDYGFYRFRFDIFFGVPKFSRLAK